MDLVKMRVGVYPYKPTHNPYQRLFTEAVEACGVEVVRIAPKKVLPLHRALSYGIDVLHLDWPHDLYSGRNAATRFVKRGMYQLGLRRLAKCSLVWTAHNIVSHDAQDDHDDITMIQQLVDHCDGIVAMSRAAAVEVRRHYRIPFNTHLAIIPHGHYIDVYPNNITQRDARRVLGLPAEGKIVLSLGSIRRYKGGFELIEAFGQVGRPGDVLLMAGAEHDKGLAESLRKYGRERIPGTVQFRLDAGLVPGAQLQIYFNASDVVALPFTSVLNSGSLLLAMSFGRCVVAPRLGSIPEVACPEAYFGYETGNPEGLKSVLARVLKDGELLVRGEIGKVYARENYSWQSVGQGAARLYDAVLSRGDLQDRRHWARSIWH